MASSYFNKTAFWLGLVLAFVITGDVAAQEPKTLLELATARFGGTDSTGKRQLEPAALKLVKEIADRSEATYATGVPN
jgi:hypothetical protein